MEIPVRNCIMGMLLACPIPIRRESMRVKFLVKQKDPSIFHCKFHPNIPIHTNWYAILILAYKTCKYK